MEPKRSKYDTNPLDGRVVDRADGSFGSARPGPPTDKVAGGPTRDIGRHDDDETVRAYSETEAPTRRIDDGTSYPSVFVPPPPRQSTTYAPPRVPAVNIYQPPPVPPPNVYLPPPFPVLQRPTSTRVAGLNIPQRWANLLPYIPGHVGAVAAVVELLLVPHTETRARFHAAQGLALQIAILILTGALGFVSLISGSSFGSRLFGFASTIFLIVSMVRAWKGKPHHIAPLDEATKFFGENIKPRK